MKTRSVDFGQGTARSGTTSLPPRRTRSPKGSSSIIVRWVPGGRPARPTLWNASVRRVAEGRRRFRGRLGPVEDGNVTIEVDRREWKLPLAGISKARLVG